MPEIVDLDTLTAAIVERRLVPSTEPIYVSTEAMMAIMSDPRLYTNPAFRMTGRGFRWRDVPVLRKPPNHKPMRP